MTLWSKQKRFMNSIKILDIFIGNKCNLACFQCDTRSDIFRTGQHDQDLENILDGIRLTKEKFHIHNYSLLGGEPLLYLDRVEEILKYIRSYDNETVIMLPTNGSLIYKHLDRLVYIINTYKVFLVVCDHFSAFVDRTKSHTLKKQVNDLIKKLGYDKVDPKEFFYNIMDWNNTAQDSQWQEFLDVRGNINDSFLTDELYLKNKHGVFFKSQDTFDVSYISINKKPKPFNSPDAQLSYKNGCCSPFCTFLYNKTLSKCAALGTLKKFLTHHNILDDADWQKYLSYKPLNLETCTMEEIENFSNTKYKGIEYCTMCPHTEQKYTKTPETVLPGFKRV
jgi:organic radical activating enzyme